MREIILIPILFPILGGLGLSLSKVMENNRAIRQIYVMAVLTIELALIFLFMQQKGSGCQVFQLVDRIPVFFQIDEISMLFSGLIAVIWWLSGLFALEYMKHEGHERSYFVFYLIAEGVLTGVSYAGNLVTLYLCFECMTLLTMPLVLHARTKQAVRAARKYMFYSIFGASTSLGGIFILAMYAPSIVFRAGGVFTTETFGQHPKLYLWVAGLMIVGFCGKAGMFPLHGWLPTAHPQAPAPASAVMSGIITKMGVLTSIRVAFYIFGADFLRGTWVQALWMILAVLTIFMGSMMAYKEPSMKRRFAYSTVSQVSYILLGLSSMTIEGMTGGILHIVFHAVSKTALFLMSGSVIYYTGKKKVRELDGIGKQMSAVIICYTIASAALVGIPPLSGFVSKEFLAHGAMEAGIPVLGAIAPVVLLASAILTAGYLFPITIHGYFPEKEEDPFEKIRIDRKMLLPLVILGVSAVILGICPGKLIVFAEQISEMLL
ncbi:MAG: proton-conducting transporter membrane subunit [Lachnospiraceae bacterium]|nr:proton-conducting transporter membrane subunit [Lachnospiraceae bacterium]